MGRTGELCGTVTGALMIISLCYGAAAVNDPAAKTKTYERAQEFMRQFQERHRSMICRDLIGFDIGLKTSLTPDERAIISRQCPEYITDAARLLEEIL